MDKKTKSGAKKKSKIASKKTVKGTANAKTKKAAKKSAKSPAKNKTNIVARKKNRSVAKSKIKIKAKKKVVSAVKGMRKSTDKQERQKPVNPKIQKQVVESSHSEPITRGEDLHFIPSQGQVHPVTPIEARQAEKIFHHREETALHQENRKMKEAMASKNTKRYYRVLGKR